MPVQMTCIRKKENDMYFPAMKNISKKRANAQPKVCKCKVNVLTMLFTRC